jgi:pentatricopeptide repeat protein
MAGPSALRPANANIVDRFIYVISGRPQAIDVLKVTSSAIKRCGNDLPAAMACFAELKRCVNRETGERVQPNVVTCNAMITAHGNAGDLEGAKAAFADLQRRGLEPNVVTCTAMITAHGNAGDLEGASRWRLASERGVLPTSFDLDFPDVLTRPASAEPRDVAPVPRRLSL